MIQERAGSFGRATFGLILGLGLLALPSDDSSVHAQQTDGVPRLLRTFQGHSQSVRDVAYHPNGKQIASCSFDGTVRIWDANTGRELHTLRGHGGDYVEGVAFSPNGKWLASVGWDQQAILWDTATGRKVHTWDLDKGGELAGCVAFSPDSRNLVVAGELVIAGEEEPIYIIEIATSRILRTLKGHFNGIFSVAMSPDGRLLASAGSQDGEIILWDFATGRRLRTLEPKTDRIWKIAFRPDGKTLASGGEDHLIRLWDVATGRELLAFTIGSEEVESVAFHKDGKLLASAGNQGGVKLWDCDSGKELHLFNAHTKAASQIVFHPDGKLLLTASNDQTVKLWDVAGLVLSR